MIFVNPYESNLALIGTTDIPYDGKAEDVEIDTREIDYLLDAVNRYLKTPLQPADIVHSFSGVRPLYDDSAANPSAVTRDYVFDVDGDPPLLSVFGGKITTYRKLAEHALEKLKPFLPHMKVGWTSAAALPGGDMTDGNFGAFLSALRRTHPWLPEALALHYARLYGTRAQTLIGEAKDMNALGRHFGGMLYEREIAYLKETEWARGAEDILTRRTKHGLHLSTSEREAVLQHMGA